LKNKTYYKTSQELRWGLNIGYEFSNIDGNCIYYMKLNILFFDKIKANSQLISWAAKQFVKGQLLHMQAAINTI
jgi:hypothetical protein